jgi:hypothetical protein
MVDPWQSLPVVCVTVLAASVAAVDGFGVPRCFVTPIVNPFGEVGDKVLEHVSVIGFLHMSCEITDIVISVHTVPAV